MMFLPHLLAPWFSIGLLAGPTWMDRGLANYQWDVSPRVAWGAQALAGAGRFGTGVRVGLNHTTQNIGLPDAPSTTVQAMTWDLIGQGRLATVRGTDVLAVASVGRLDLSYTPDLIEVPGAGSGRPVFVELKPIHEWTGGMGLALKRPLTGPLALGFEVNHRIFGLDTAHRNGQQIEVGRQTFGDWSAHLELAWSHRRH